MELIRKVLRKLKSYLQGGKRPRNVNWKCLKPGGFVSANMWIFLLIIHLTPFIPA